MSFISILSDHFNSLVRMESVYNMLIGSVELALFAAFTVALVWLIRFFNV